MISLVWGNHGLNQAWELSGSCQLASESQLRSNIAAHRELHQFSCFRGTSTNVRGVPELGLVPILV